jgi:hypothetical protein
MVYKLFMYPQIIFFDFITEDLINGRNGRNNGLWMVYESLGLVIINFGIPKFILLNVIFSFFHEMNHPAIGVPPFQETSR